jgi:hypothetical protein
MVSVTVSISREFYLRGAAGLRVTVSRQRRALPVRVRL